MQANYENLNISQLFDLAQRQGLDLTQYRQSLIQLLQQNDQAKMNVDYEIFVYNTKGQLLNNSSGQPLKFDGKGNNTIADIRIAIAQQMNKQVNDVNFSSVKGVRREQIGGALISFVNVNNKQLRAKQFGAADLKDTRTLSEFYPFTQLNFTLSESFFGRFF